MADTIKYLIDILNGTSNSLLYIISISLVFLCFFLLHTINELKKEGKYDTYRLNIISDKNDIVIQTDSKDSNKYSKIFNYINDAIRSNKEEE